MVRRAGVGGGEAARARAGLGGTNFGRAGCVPLSQRSACATSPPRPRPRAGWGTGDAEGPAAPLLSWLEANPAINPLTLHFDEKAADQYLTPGEALAAEEAARTWNAVRQGDGAGAQPALLRPRVVSSGSARERGAAAGAAIDAAAPNHVAGADMRERNNAPASSQSLGEFREKHKHKRKHKRKHRSREGSEGEGEEADVESASERSGRAGAGHSGDGAPGSSSPHTTPRPRGSSQSDPPKQVSNDEALLREARRQLAASPSLRLMQRRAGAMHLLVQVLLSVRHCGSSTRMEVELGVFQCMAVLTLLPFRQYHDELLQSGAMLLMVKAMLRVHGLRAQMQRTAANTTADKGTQVQHTLRGLAALEDAAGCTLQHLLEYLADCVEHDVIDGDTLRSLAAEYHDADRRAQERRDHTGSELGLASPEEFNRDRFELPAALSLVQDLPPHAGNGKGQHLISLANSILTQRYVGADRPSPLEGSGVPRTLGSCKRLPPRLLCRGPRSVPPERATVKQQYKAILAMLRRVAQAKEGPPEEYAPCLVRGEGCCT